MTRAAPILALAAVLGIGFAAPAPAAEQDGPPLSAAPKPAPPVPAYIPPARNPPGRSPQHSDDSEAAEYQRCLLLTKTDPGAARDMAEHWQSHAGGHPADHCYAVSLVELKQYKEGATRLEALAKAMVHAPASLRAEVLDQASQAWLLEGDPSRAYAASTAALNLLPGDPDLLTDRAEAAGNGGWYDKALDDLNQVLKTDANRLDALIYRASTYRAQNKLDPALADINRAVSLSPNSVEALLERGNILRLTGNLDGARHDWVRVSELAPGSTADADAKINIERLELKEDVAAPAPTKR